RPHPSARPRARRPVGHLPRPLPGAPRGLRSPREHHRGGRRPRGARAALPLRPEAAGGPGSDRAHARGARPRRPQDRMGRRDGPPPLRAGRVPGEARRPDPAPPDQPRFVFLAPHAQARARAVAYDPAEPAGVGPSAPAQQPGADPPRPAPEPSVVSTPEVSPDESRTGGTEKPRRWA